MTVRRGTLHTSAPAVKRAYRWQASAIPLALACLILARLLLQARLYEAGFAAVTADEFARTLMAARWAREPYLLWHGAWLPLHMYLLGALLKLQWELLLVPRALSLLLGVLALPLMYRLTSALFARPIVSLLSAILLTVNPAHLWLTAVPLTEGLYMVLLLAALGCGARFVRQGERRELYGAALLLALAGGVRFEGWAFALFWTLFLLGEVAAGGRRRSRGARISNGDYLLAALIPWLFPVLWLVMDYVGTGDWLFSLRAVTSYKEAWFGEERSFGRYWHGAFDVDPIVVLFFLPALTGYLLHAPRSRAVGWYLGMLLLPLALFLLLHGGRAEPPGILLRYLSPFLTLSLPPIALLLLMLAERATSRPPAAYLLLALMLAGVATVQVSRAFNFTNDPAATGLAVGERIRAARGRPAPTTRPAVIELNYWEYLAIHTGANDIDTILYDRPLDLERRASRSWLLSEPEQFRQCLASYDVELLVLRAPELRAAARDFLGLSPIDEVNGYAFYRLPPDLVGSESGCELALHP